MKLIDIYSKYSTDKGTEHNYIPSYDNLFSRFRLKNNKILEIGILHGESVKMWNEFFENSLIYGVDNFSHIAGYTPSGPQKVDWQSVVNSFNDYDRVNIVKCDSTNDKDVKENLKDLVFDIIIDDGSHVPTNQVKTIELFYPLLSQGGLYIVEDVISRNAANLCIECLNRLSGKNAYMVELDVHRRHDDRLVVLEN